MIDQKQTEKIESCYYLGRKIRSDARCMLETKSRISLTQAAFSQKKALFTRKFD